MLWALCPIKCFVRAASSDDGIQPSGQAKAVGDADITTAAAVRDCCCRIARLVSVGEIAVGKVTFHGSLLSRRDLETLRTRIYGLSKQSGRVLTCNSLSNRKGGVEARPLLIQFVVLPCLARAGSFYCLMVQIGNKRGDD